MQPYFGICSDHCESSWGKRRPFIFFGALAIILSLLGLAWTERLADVIVLVLGLDYHSRPLFSQIIAVFFVFALNVAIQPVQGGLRALIVDTCPRSQQQTASAWAGSITSLANVCTYALAYADLTHLFPWLGDTQFRILCAITTFPLAITILITCLAVHEKVPELQERREGNESILSKLSHICSRFYKLPTQIQRVFKVQFCAWMGWFPFLFNITTYVILL